jgi:hypothetical protein
VLLPTAVEEDKFLLCGQRTLALLEQLPLGSESLQQPGGQGPTAVRLLRIAKEAASVQVTLRAVTVRVEAGTALGRADQLPTLERWQDELSQVDRPALHSFESVERWNDDRSEAQEEHGLRENHGQYVGPAGMYQLTRTGNCRWGVTVFFDPSKQRFLRGDWYGLRFLARRAAGLPCRAFWGDNTLVVHVEERWPMRFEQALVCSTGLLPARVRGRWLSYRDVPKPFVQRLCQRLGVSLQSLPAAALARGGS